MRRGLTFDDVCLVPRYNNVSSRTEPKLTTWLTKNTQVGMPLVPANMDTVIGDNLARVVVNNGGIPLFHRFTTLEQKELWLKEFPNCFLSFGLGKESIKEIEDFVDGYDLKGVVLDVAHGHSLQMIDTIKHLKITYPSLEIIAGNVCTARGYHDLFVAGADAVKVGIGPGAACTTRTVTGFGVPQFTAIRDCAEEASHLRIPIIADGGIRNSSDIVKALGAGASTVMIGKLFALTEESAAKKRSTPLGNHLCSNLVPVENPIVDGVQVRCACPKGVEVKFRGQASADFQNEYYGGLKEKTVAEGTDFWAPVSGSAQELIDGLLGGLRSGLTYGGARSIKELQRKAEFVEVAGGYSLESNPRRN